MSVTEILRRLNPKTFNERKNLTKHFESMKPEMRKSVLKRLELIGWDKSEKKVDCNKCMRIKTTFCDFCNPNDVAAHYTEDINEKPLPLTIRVKSWKWFFNCIFNLTGGLRRCDGQSMGNFWAIVQCLEQEFLSQGLDWQEECKHEWEICDSTAQHCYEVCKICGKTK